MKDNIGNILKNLRKTSGLTQKELSKKLFCDPSLICKYERDEVPPSRTMLTKYIEYFDMNLESFGLDGFDVQAPKNSRESEVREKLLACLRECQEIVKLVSEIMKLLDE